MSRMQKEGMQMYNTGKHLTGTQWSGMQRSCHFANQSPRLRVQP